MPTYFASLISANHAVAYNSVVPASPSAHADVCNLPLISPSTCSALLSELKPKTSSGVDTVSAVVLYDPLLTLSTPLYTNINSSSTSISFPSRWKFAIIHPLH